MKFLPSRFGALLLKTLALYVALSLLLFLLPARWTTTLRAVLLYPFAVAGGAFLEGLSPAEITLDRAREMWRAQKEVERLRAGESALRRQLLQESERRRFLESHVAQIAQIPEEQRRNAVSAALAGYDASPARRSAVFDRGRNAGIARGDPVLWNGALVGRVESVAPRHCTALLVGDRQLRVPVRCVRSRVQGVLEGIGGGLCAVRHVPVTADVRPGDIFLTSGVDGLLPPALLVGECIEASDESGAPFKWIPVRPAYDPSRLETVAILILPPSEAP